MIEAGARILIDVLARVNCIFTPIRYRVRRLEIAIQELQHDYGGNGVPYRAGGDVARRKARERSLNELARAGLVTLLGDARRSRVKLSDECDSKLRATAGLSGLTETLCLMAGVVEATVKGWAYGGPSGVFVPECYLTGMNWRDPEVRPQVKKRIFILEEFSLYGQVRGWLSSFYDTKCQWFYSVTPAGHQVLEHLPELRSDGSYNSEAANYYDDGFPEAETWLSTVRPSLENQAVIPFPAGLGSQAYNERLAGDHPLVELFQRIEKPPKPERKPKCRKAKQ